ncbi:hypothetical protein ACFYSW_27705 [Rhodococcus aetherivorans]|uniref:hypothetical protein n=1 Tax=Rhodococcus aetherivorans TaxID=191292 RepID=UPI00367590B0
MNYPADLAVSGETLYLTEIETGRVLSVPVTGGTPTPIATGLNRPYGIAVSGGIVYVAEIEAGRVVSVPTTGGTPPPWPPI